MRHETLFYAIILLIGVFIGAISQVLLKKAALEEYDNPLKEYLNPMVVFAYILFIATTFFSVFAYREIPLSMGPLLETTSYIYVTFFGVVIFKEKMNVRKAIALCFIICGIIIFALFG